MICKTQSLKLCRKGLPGTEFSVSHGHVWVGVLGFGLWPSQGTFYVWGTHGRRVILFPGVGTGNFSADFPAALGAFPQLGSVWEPGGQASFDTSPQGVTCRVTISLPQALKNGKPAQFLSTRWWS